MKLEGIREALVNYLNQPTVKLAVLALVLVYVVVWLRIFRRAGLPRAFGVLMLVPPLTFVLPLYMAFTRWPVERPPIRTAKVDPRAKVRAAAQHAVRTALRKERQEQERAAERPRSILLELADDAAPQPVQRVESVYGGRDYIPLRLKPQPDTLPPS